MLVINNSILDAVRHLKEFSAHDNHRGQIILRILAALFGGYALTYSFLMALALLLPWPRVDVVFFSGLFPSIVWLVVLLWAFAAPTAQRAWRDIAGTITFFGIMAVMTAWYIKGV